ncbi:MAG: glycoside hydrolase family 88 protein [Saprospiraceae bacterium]|nr:glycoside hydrolase family 88 protein [Saprospiraceae bacterium]
MATTLMQQHANGLVYDTTKPERWNYELGVLLVGIEQVWHKTGDAKYFTYIQKLIDEFVQEDGTVRTYVLEDYNLDMLPPARCCLLLYKVSGKEKYKKAAQTFRSQLVTQPRLKDGGFWHKKRYPSQMWLDGLYMAEPFFSEYSLMFNELQNFDEVANQLILMDKNAVDPATGLLHHAYNEDRQQQWVDKKTGHSPHFWGRAMGWYAIALVDVLDYFPTNHLKRKEIEAILQRLAAAAVKVQDAKTGVWYQILDKPSEQGNYLEASASSMFCYAMLKGVRQGVLDKKYLIAAKKAYTGILKEFISTDANNNVHLNHVCMVAGLGGNPYRDGSFKYYVTEPQRTDDIKGAAPFMMASVEMENLANGQVGAGKTVVLDYFFNHEFKKDAKTNDWTSERFHYTWEGAAHGEFTFLGHIFRNMGAKTDSLAVAPTAENLKNASVYIIVDPDSKKETPTPNYVESAHVEAIKAWVKKGGVLLLMANDTANCEIPHFNNLARAFGAEFTSKSLHMVKNDTYEQGAVTIPTKHAIFKTARKVFIKELSVLSLKKPAKAQITEGSDVLIATAKYGKGSVFIIGDPWLYNEYVDGRKMPIELGYENFKAANDLATWLLMQVKK